MTASLPPLLSVITTLAPTHPDHPAKAQAVAAELKVWKSWRGMRSQRGESNPENQVGKGWKGDKQGALLRDWWQLRGQQFERASRACLPQNKHRSPTEWCSFSLFASLSSFLPLPRQLRKRFLLYIASCIWTDLQQLVIKTFRSSLCTDQRKGGGQLDEST